MSYLSSIYLESWFFWLGEGAQKTFEKERKHTRRKALKNEEKENKEYRGSQITAINIFGLIMFSLKTWFTKIFLYHHILFTVFVRCRIFET